MLALLSPAALWALAALALPLTLHLWRQPSRTVLLGSLRFLPRHAGRRLRDLRWRERLLLSTRLALLALLAGLLGHPLWQRPPPRGALRWILLDPLADLTGTVAARLQTLQIAGYTTHWLTPGLPVAAQPPDDPAARAPDLWSLLRETDATLPPGSTLAIFSPARFATLRGIRPKLRAKVEWITTPDLAGKAPHAWLQALAPVTPPFTEPLATIGIGDASSVRFASAPPDGWKLATRFDSARLLGPEGTATSWQTAAALPAISVLVLHDLARAEDARYLVAALRAAAPTGGTPVDIHMLGTDAELATLPAADWTFWLSATPPAAILEARHTRFFTDAPAENALAVDEQIVAQPGTPGAEFLSPSIRLWQRGAPPPGAVVWTDAHGSPLLTRTERGSGPHWRFAARFHPAWTNLPQTTAFPAWLQALLWNNSPSDPSRDFRQAAAFQAEPSDLPSPAFPTAMLTGPAATYDLHGAFWLAAAILFGLERALSHRRSVSPPGPAAASLPADPVPA